MSYRYSSGRVVLTLAALVGVAPALAQNAAPLDVPKAHDPRLVVERFAAAPDIVHPVNIAFDSRGRLLVIESHTHFRPAGYKGPKHDRVRILEDTDGDGQADRFTTFFEGTQATMDVACHPDGSIYLATRNEILRLRDTKGDGKADEQKRLVFLDTKGTYPHNGLSGLAFDSKGNLFFGMGENLGVSYKLSVADGTTIAAEGEGGNIFWCTADGKQLRRVATGFWNPFGVGTDIYGRLFAVDNDPDAMPPCRLLHVVPGGDYGFSFRYGRSGRHPFQAWNGQLPGTLPMAAGTGEGPCKVLSYESDGLPPEYLGSLLITSWADHRVERYVVSDRGASVGAERKPFVQGGKDFRPVGLAVAPDGSLFVSDWVLSDYNLHGRGAVWHIRQREAKPPERPREPRRALTSLHRPLRESAAKQLTGTEAGRAFLREQAGNNDPRIRAAVVAALIDVDDRQLDLSGLAEKEPIPALRALAVRAWIARGQDASALADGKQPPAVRAEAIASLHDQAARPRLLALLSDPDPFLRQAAVRQLALTPELLADLDVAALTGVQQRLGVLLAHRASGRPEMPRLVQQFLQDPDPEVRFLAAKWIADRKLTELRPALVEALKDPRLSIRLYFAYASALASIDNRSVHEGKMADFFLARLSDPKAGPALQVASLQLVPASHKKLTLEVLSNLLRSQDAGVRLEAVRLLNEHPDARRLPMLLEMAHDEHQAEAMRAEALVGVADQSQNALDALLDLASSEHPPAIRNEALRGLTGTRLSLAQCEQINSLGKRQPAAADLAARVLGKPFAKDRPTPRDLDAWSKRLEGPSDPAAGRRVFFHPKLGACHRCHKVDGRGADIGPDLSAAGRTDRRSLLESILQPSNNVAPHYQTWSIVTADGKTFNGMLIRTLLDTYTYIDAKGAPFKLNTRDVVESQPLPASIMPNGLADLLTDQELRDLLAYLETRR